MRLQTAIVTVGLYILLFAALAATLTLLDRPARTTRHRMYCTGGALPVILDGRIVGCTR